VLVVLLFAWSHFGVMLKYDINGVTERALDFITYVFFDPFFGVTSDLKEAVDRSLRKILQPSLCLVAEARRSRQLALFKCLVFEVVHEGEFGKTLLGERNSNAGYRGHLSSRFELINSFAYASRFLRGSDVL
jgi:hypothetical protein